MTRRKRKNVGEYTVPMTGAQRVNILHEISRRALTFESSGTLLPVWKAVLGTWDWRKIAKDMRTHHMLANSPDTETAKKARAEIDAQNAFVDSIVEGDQPDLKMPGKTLNALREFLHEKLSEEAPEDKESDGRWKGLVALTMRELYDEVEALLEGGPGQVVGEE